MTTNTSTSREQNDVLPLRHAVGMFMAFAAAYFLSTLLRAITATLSPTLSSEFGLQARDLGLLAGGYFLGFALTQLPMGHWLDQQGPRKVVLRFLTMAVVGCLAFAWANSFFGLLLARVLMGVGVSACLMAPLTGYRRWLALGLQHRANAWMLMTGAFGMLASTLPVQWLLPLVGWRWLFVGVACLVVMVMVLLWQQVPAWRQNEPAHGLQVQTQGVLSSYSQVWRHPYFRRLTPLGFFNYGGLVAMQTLWAAPWMIKVAGYTQLQAATGLFWINVCMLAAYWVWGLVTPWLNARGYHADRLIAWGVPLNLAIQVFIVWSGSAAGAMHWILFCISSTFVSLAQPAVGMAFPSALAGRALSAYNLVLFLGVFVVQWGMGLLIDGFKTLGVSEPLSFQGALGVFCMCCAASYLYFLKSRTEHR